MKAYDAKEEQICLICKEKFNYNKQGKFTSHLKLHSLSLDEYLTNYFYTNKDLKCSTPVCKNRVKVRNGVPNKYCSKGCWQRKSKTRNCLSCNQPFTKEDIRVKTCSKDCAQKLKSKKITSWHNNMSPKEKEDHFERIITKTARTRRKNKTPSWNSGKVGIYSEETINKIRQATLRQMENQSFKKTSIERIMESLLDELSISYKYSFIIENKQYDFLLINLNLIIECDGDYWHANPKYYPVPEEWQKERIAIDHEKNRIAIENGYFIVRFWEDDIKNNLDIVKKILASYMTHKPQRSW